MSGVISSLSDRKELPSGKGIWREGLTSNFIVCFFFLLTEPDNFMPPGPALIGYSYQSVL